MRNILPIAALAVAAAGLTAQAEAADFYAGRTISLMVASTAGGGYDVYARTLARYLPRHIPGAPTIVVQYQAGGGGLVAANTLYNTAAKDGTAIATFARNMPLLGILGGNANVQFDSRKFTWLGSPSSAQDEAYILWARKDARVKSLDDARRPGGPELLLGGTAGRTTLNGEGLQHQDGHSHLFAMAYPTVKAYDPAFVYETTVIMLDGMERMYAKGEDWIYYITVYNENYEMPPMPAGCEEGILKGMYRLKDVPATGQPVAAGLPRVNLFGSGTILREVIRAADLLAEHWGVASTVWSVTSWKELRREAQECRRWTMLHPDAPPKVSYLEATLAGTDGVYVAASDHVRAVPEQLDPWVPGGLFVLGTDGFGRSELRGKLRRHFEVDAECIAIGTLSRLAAAGAIGSHVVAEAIKRLGVDPAKVDPASA